MPVVSRAQNRWAHWAAEHASDPKERAAGAEYVSASHGMKVSKLPERVKKPAKKKAAAAPVFGALDV